MLWPNGANSRPRITSGFGTRVHPVTGKVKKHRGVDLVGFSTVRAIAAGTVYKVGTPIGWSGGGTQVWIKHDGGFIGRYLHLVKGSTLVVPGRRVVEGQALGTMGMTGTATGVHLHLEIVVRGVQIDPISFISARVPAGAGASTGGTAAPNLKDNDMDCMILINGKIYALDPGFIKHCDSVEQVREALARGVKQYDYTGPDRLDQWARALDFYGIPRNVLSAAGYVLNPESGKPEVGGLWTWSRAVLAAVAKS